MSSTANFRIEKATLMKDINKYYPGEAPFYIPAVTPFSSDSVINANRRNSANKEDKFNTTTVTTVAAITLTVPKDIVRDYKKKIIPKGTEFYVAFIGGDITKPRIIGVI